MSSAPRVPTVSLPPPSHLLLVPFPHSQCLEGLSGPLSPLPCSPQSIYPLGLAPCRTLGTPGLSCLPDSSLLWLSALLEALPHLHRSILTATWLRRSLDPSSAHLRAISGMPLSPQQPLRQGSPLLLAAFVAAPGLSLGPPDGLPRCRTAASSPGQVKSRGFPGQKDFWK